MKCTVVNVGLSLLALVSVTACESIDLDRNELIGAASAAVGCALISKQTGGDDEQVAAAAIVCGVVGYAVTNKLENDREKYATDEEFYMAETQRLKQYDASLKSQIASSEAELANTHEQVKEVIARSNRTAADRAILETINNDLNIKKTLLEEELEVAEDNLKYQKGLNIRMQETQGNTNPDAEKQLADLEASVQELNQLVGAHERQSASIGVYL
jgi:hypothetical protein